VSPLIVKSESEYKGEFEAMKNECTPLCTTIEQAKMIYPTAVANLHLNRYHNVLPEGLNFGRS
jgi:hypothetical protein